MAHIPWVYRVQADAEWEGAKAVRFQLDGNDLVNVVDVDRDTGDARIMVFASTAPDAEVIFEGTVNIRAHLDLDGDEERY
jgi:hypothetical protein